MAVGTDGASVGIVHHDTERTVERLCPGVRARGRRCRTRGVPFRSRSWGDEPAQDGGPALLSDIGETDELRHMAQLQARVAELAAALASNGKVVDQAHRPEVGRCDQAGVGARDGQRRQGRAVDQRDVIHTEVVLRQARPRLCQHGVSVCAAGQMRGRAA